MSCSTPETPLTLHQQQARFTAFIRDPQQNPAPSDVPPSRISIYAELMFNNIESFLAATFPVVKTIHSPENWQQLVRDFYSQHQNQTPYFATIPEEFLSYLQDERHNPADFPFLLELAHYEWVEVALAIAQEEPLLLSSTAQANILQQCISLSPLAWPLAYHYPVQQISPDFLPGAAPAESTLLCVYRDSEDEVRFMQITPMTYHLLELLQAESPCTGEQYLQQLVDASQYKNPEFIYQTAFKMLQDLAQKCIIVQA